MPVITISRQMGSLGDEVASALSRKLGWECITRDLLMERFFPESSADQRTRLAESARFYLSEYKDGRSFCYCILLIRKAYFVAPPRAT